MDTTQESYLDLFPLDAIVYLTPDSENGKYFTCFRHRGARANRCFLSFSFSDYLILQVTQFQVFAVSNCMRCTVYLYLMLDLFLFESVFMK